MTIDPPAGLLATLTVGDWLEAGVVVKIIVAGICWLFDEAGELADFVTIVVIGKVGIIFVDVWTCGRTFEVWIVDVVACWLSLLAVVWLALLFKLID